MTLNSVLSAQNSSNSSADILQSLQKLNTVATVLYVAAHPDDENTRLLAYLAKEKKFRTAYLSLTRGDGGQNLIGSEQGDMLGVIRTEELLAARKVDGAEQYFTRAVDFGYSKNPAETFTHWDKKTILWDVVLTIRRLRPDIIICRFPTTGEGGHGHHTASAMLALEAFTLAADSTAFTDQLQEVKVWKAKRILWNTFNFGTTNTTAPDQFKLDVGAYNVLAGKGYGEIAAESRTNHKSQGFGSAAARGSAIEYFKLLKGDTIRSDIFEGVNASWSRFPKGNSISSKIDKLIKSFDALHPERSVPALLELHKQLKIQAILNGKSSYYYLKLQELEQIIFNCSGIWMECQSKDLMLIPGETAQLNAQFIVRNPTLVKLKSVSFNQAADTLVDTFMRHNVMLKCTRKIVVPDNIPYTDPYWLKVPHEQAIHIVHQNKLIGLPQTDCPLTALYTFEIGNTEFKVLKPVVFKLTDPVRGEYYKPIEILPPVTVTPTRPVLVTASDEERSLFFLVKSNIDNFEGTLNVKMTSKLDVRVLNPSFTLAKKGDEKLIEVKLRIKDPQFNGNLKAYVMRNDKRYGMAIQRIAYEHIPSRFILKEADVKLIRTDIKMAGKKLAYIEGAGDDVAECLTDLGYSVTTLNNEQLMNDDLSVYDAIVVGIRAFNTNENLYLSQERLMTYVKNGGRLIVQYNTNSRVGPLNAGIGPYKFTISRNRVTDENASVGFVNDSLKVLQFPNIISQNDFKNWVQERGIYFATELDSSYQTVFTMNDPGEKSEKGSLIMASYGKGYFVYTGLAFFRQLPAGVPGAYRLMINLISQPTKP
ncbi:MAG: PIG-L family deacetylase [Chitinophagaceae bacterium]